MDARNRIPPRQSVPAETGASNVIRDQKARFLTRAAAGDIPTPDLVGRFINSLTYLSSGDEGWVMCALGEEAGQVHPCELPLERLGDRFPIVLKVE